MMIYPDKDDPIYTNETQKRPVISSQKIDQ